MTNLDIEAVQAFVLVADFSSFTRAGEAMDSSQSAVSLKIKRLEDGLGRRLFERTPRRVRLTDAGQLFLERARLLIVAHGSALDAFATERRRLVVGISDHAQESLGDVVYVDLPKVGQKFGAGEIFGVVESVKAASDLFAPLGGEVVAVNEALAKGPEAVNQDPYGAGWMVKVKPADLSQWEALLSPADYEGKAQ